MSTKLEEDTINFGKYRNCKLSTVLRDRKYCAWVLEQDWFKTQYEFLYNRIATYDPKKFFIKPNSLPITTVEDFLNNYTYFNLTPLEKLEIELSEEERRCYTEYLKIIESFKVKITNNKADNPYDIKAPSAWLSKLEKDTGLRREVFKEFLQAYELPNIPYIIQDIKQMGGIDYKGAKSFLIAKTNSLKQEEFWGTVLKKYYGDEITIQHVLGNCIFDFLNKRKKILYECKLNLKDFNEKQFNEYRTATQNSFSLVYLIGEHTIIDISAKTIHSTAPEKLFSKIKDGDFFLELLKTFSVEKINNIQEYFS
jgi:hypothetical protein